MIYYIHKFKLSSGNTRKTELKVYASYGKAMEQLKLLGGEIRAAKVESDFNV